MTWRDVLFEFDGRIDRRTFWIAFLAVAVAELFCHAVVGLVADDRATSIVSLAFSYPEFAIMAKRGHDRGMPTMVPGVFFGLSILVDFVFVLDAAGTPEQPSPLLMMLTVPWLVFAVALLVDLGFRRGTRGPNRYGPDPQGPTIYRIDRQD